MILGLGSQRRVGHVESSHVKSVFSYLVAHYPPITRKRSKRYTLYNVQARLAVASHLSTTPRWGESCQVPLSTAQLVNLPAYF